MDLKESFRVANVNYHSPCYPHGISEGKFREEGMMAGARPRSWEDFWDGSAVEEN